MKYLAIATALISLTLSNIAFAEDDSRSDGPKATKTLDQPRGTTKPLEQGDIPNGNPTKTEQGDVPKGTTKPLEQGDGPRGNGTKAFDNQGDGTKGDNAKIDSNKSDNAKDNSEKGGESNGKDGKLRQNSEVQSGDNRFSLSSGDRTGSVRTRIDMGFRTAPVPSFGLRFFAGSKDTTNKCGFRVDFVRLVEYNDTISPKDSLAKVDFGSLPQELWSSLKNGGVFDKVVNGANVKTLTTTLAFPPAGAQNFRPELRQRFGNLSITVSADITDAPVTTADGQTLSPFGLKYSIYIDNWVPKLLNSKLLLIKALFTKDNNATRNGDARNVSLSNGCGNFNWNGTVLNGDTAVQVLLNGTLQDDGDNIVQARPPPDSDQNDDGKYEGSRPKLISFTLPMGPHLAWDPEVAVSDQQIAAAVQANQPNSASTVAAPVALALMASLFSLVF